MKVCLIMPNIFPVPATRGGACETLVNNIIDENEKKKEVEITCVSIFEKEAYEKSKKYCNTSFIFIENGINIDTKDCTFKSEDKEFVNYMDEVYDKIKDEYFDYIIIEGGNLREYKYLLNKLPKSKCIAHLHGNYVGDEILDNTYEYFITVSDYIAIKLTGSGFIEKDRVERLYNGVKIENFDRSITEEEKNKLKNKYKIKDSDRLIIFCGRTVKRKGIKELILAFKNIKDIENTKLMIVGNSNFADEVQTDYDRELVEISKEVKDKIIFSGYIPNEELYKIYNLADLAAFPTLSEEAFGLVVVEAMASGCPVILTRSGAFPEIAKNTSTILINKEDTIVEELTTSINYLLENPEIREKMKIEGKERARSFSNQKFYDNFVKILNRLRDKQKKEDELDR